MKDSNFKKVAKINNVEIVVIENGEKRVPIKPICEALGVNYSTQLEKLKSDEILGSVILLRGTTGSDGKEYKMQTIPFKYVFGWLFTINPKNVAPEAKEAVIKYKLACYDALYEHFEGLQKFLQEKEKSVETNTETLKLAKKSFNNAKDVLRNTEEELYRVAKLTYEEYKNQGFQLSLPTEDA